MRTLNLAILSVVKINDDSVLQDDSVNESVQY